MALFDIFRKNKGTKTDPKNNGAEEVVEEVASPAEDTQGQAAAAETETQPKTEEIPEVIEEIEIGEEREEESVAVKITDEPEGTVQIQETPVVPAEPPAPEKKGFFKKMLAGLDKTRKNIIGNVETILKSFTKIDESLYEELEEALISADIGVTTSMNLIERLRERVREEKATEMEQVKAILIDEITKILEEGHDEFKLASPCVLLVIGVNGVGKTTTIGKLASNFKADGKKVVLAAADTFRAAAIDQLEIWGHRSDIPVIKHQENSDPAAVVFDAVQAAKARNADILICDTAGRLHNKKNLMEELRKISKIIGREYPQAQQEVFIVLDATTGQNALQQASVFKEICDITGIVLTKLDGTAKGGIIIAIKNELKIPIRFIGVGEGIDDLQPFNPQQFAKALFDSHE